MTFSDKIKLSRELCNLTQQQLADKVGVSKRTIASYESSGAIARSSTMRKLAKALNVSYDYLTNDDITDPKQGIEKIEYIEEARNQFGNRAAKEVDELLERNAALFAGGELSEDEKYAFFTAVTKAYLECEEKEKKTYGRKKKTESV